MITNNNDVEKMIYDEAALFYPELFDRRTPLVQYQNENIEIDRLLSDIHNRNDTLPVYESAVKPTFNRTGTPLPFPIVKAGQFAASYDIERIRSDFPILQEKVNGKRLIWFDNAATTQKPRCVIERLRFFYEHENSNIHRAAHTLARQTTEAYEGARRIVADFINAPKPEDIVFIRGATEGINLVAQSYGMAHISEGDNIVLTQLEHHANIVPWQFVCRKTGAELRVAPVDDSGQIILSDYQKLLTSGTKIVAISHVSNVLGTITPIEEMISLAHKVGAVVLVDGAQAVSHLPVDVAALDCDFYVFSGHKIFAPPGIGALYGKTALLESMAPYQGGGNMISNVTFDESRYKYPPHRFEAGTGSIADAVALGSALSYVSKIGLPAISRYERELLDYFMQSLTTLSGISYIGTEADLPINNKPVYDKSAIIAFSIRNYDSDTLAALLDREGIAVRAGHHCAQPVLRRFGFDKIVRASLAFYNTFEEINAFVSALHRITSR